MLPGLQTRSPCFSGGGWCCAWQRLRLWQLWARPSVGTAEHPSLPPTSQPRMSQTHNMLQISGAGQCVRREPRAAGLSLLSSGLSRRGGGKAAGASPTTCCSLSSSGRSQTPKEEAEKYQIHAFKSFQKKLLSNGASSSVISPRALLKMRMVEVKMETFRVCPGKGG